ncbi:hypothetical protein J7U69_06055 [Escherichia coli]|mgnify:CR=1 FL=1|uniref:hypothetical protein n=1 Tax=Escherichia TaxID=561 RepID=UPI000667E6D0|nr:hypothetical protein [Escherichia coli]EKP4089678.1 hypothetical protein [Escherichia coli O157]MEC9929954.1 hypothetical protein [Escherichia marmotae]EFB2178872.1 hypothetical protein [Escherichia coli]EFB3781496.1 hypothetical protein [Escherichia coli]EFB4039790.1 hypothetical protein [Escherichia coli]
MDTNELGLVKARVELITAMLKCATAFVMLVGAVIGVLNMAFNYLQLKYDVRTPKMEAQI